MEARVDILENALSKVKEEKDSEIKIIRRKWQSAFYDQTL